jgi:hypothetical protein
VRTDRKRPNSDISEPRLNLEQRHNALFYALFCDYVLRYLTLLIVKNVIKQYTLTSIDMAYLDIVILNFA